MAHETSPDVDETELSAEEKAKQEQDALLTQEIPEGAQATILVQLGAVFGLGRLSHQQNLSDAIGVLQKKGFLGDVVDFSDPAKFSRLVQAQKTLNREFQKKKGDKDKIQTGFWKFRKNISFEEFNQRSQAISAVQSVHDHIEAADQNLKIARTTQAYELTPESTGKLAEGLETWKKTHPGRSIDEYLLVQGEKLHLAQSGQSKKGEKKEELDTKAKELKKNLQTTRSIVIDQNRAEIISAQLASQDIVEGKLSVANKGEVEKISQDIRLGAYRKNDVQERLQHPELLYEPLPSTQPPPKPPVPSVNVPKISPPSLPSFHLPSSFLQIGERAKRLLGRISQIGNILQSTFSKLASKLLTSVFGFLGKQALIKGLGGLLTGGIATAISLGSDLLKKVSFGLIDVEGWILNAAKFAVLAVVGIVIFFLFFMSSDHTTPYYNSTDALKLQTQAKQRDVAEKRWEEFEQQHILPKIMRLSENIGINK